MRLTLAVPDLLAQSREVLDAAPSLAKVARYAGTPVTWRGGLDGFLASESAPPDAVATAPLAALGAGLDPRDRYVFRADPVSLVVGHADVMFGARISDLDTADTDALLATLNTHFGGDGLAFAAPRPDAWFVTTDVAPDLTTTPLSAVRGSIYRHLPSGKDAAKWRRWLSEMQMLLHEHPANTTREARGLVPVTGIWISGGGFIADIAHAPATAIFAAPSRPGDVARGLALLRGSAVRESPAAFAVLPRQDDAIVALDPANAANISVFERDWFGPAIVALERGSLASLTLLADGDGVAAAWRAQPPPWTLRAFAKLAPRPFTPPTPEADDA